MKNYLGILGAAFLALGVMSFTIIGNKGGFGGKLKPTNNCFLAADYVQCTGGALPAPISGQDTQSGASLCGKSSVATFDETTTACNGSSALCCFTLTSTTCTGVGCSSTFKVNTIYYKAL
jgi:hypothetical protein